MLRAASEMCRFPVTHQVQCPIVHSLLSKGIVSPLTLSVPTLRFVIRVSVSFYMYTRVYCFYKSSQLSDGTGVRASVMSRNRFEEERRYSLDHVLEASKRVEVRWD
jgi:hypothetical protein